MSAYRLFFVMVAAATLCVGGLNLVSCQQEESVDGETWITHIFGNGFQDTSPVICQVGDFKITQKMLDLRYEELSPALKSRFSGQDWEKRFLRYMVEEALLVGEASKRKIYLIPEVAQNLISARREVLQAAFENMELIKDLEPTEEQIRTFYEQNKENYIRLGLMRARHIACKDQDTAWEAYNRLQLAGRRGHWAYVVAEFSINPESAKQAGDLGYFNRGGFIPVLPYGKEFSTRIWEWDLGLHEPVEIGGDWHVIEIISREYDRPFALSEVRDRVVHELRPILEEEAVERFLRLAKQDTPIEYFGSYRPGEGRNPKELFELGWYAKTPEQQIDIFKMLVEDYPQSDYADDALFLVANIYLDNWGDIPFASRYLTRLVEDYPDSELNEDARYFLDNMRDPNFVKPSQIEDLRRRSNKD
jgi:hypothetical protein